MPPHLHRIAGTFRGLGSGRPMILRTILALGALALVSGAAAAQGYPTFGQQAYPPPYRPLPPAAVPDDDDDDIPPHQRAAPGNYPPPPGGYRGPFARETQPQYQAPPPVYSDRGPPQQQIGRA